MKRIGSIIVLFIFIFLGMTTQDMKHNLNIEDGVASPPLHGPVYEYAKPPMKSPPLHVNDKVIFFGAPPMG